VTDELRSLRDELCRSATDFCRVCFGSSSHRGEQDPPNVFRIDRKRQPYFFFIFDKPNNNDSFRTSSVVPITVFDPRPVFGSQLSHANLLRLLELLALDTTEPGDPLSTGAVHVRQSK
jgi:hypothetical protein